MFSLSTLGTKVTSFAHDNNPDNGLAGILNFVPIMLHRWQWKEELYLNKRSNEEVFKRQEANRQLLKYKQNVGFYDLITVQDMKTAIKNPARQNSGINK